MDKLPAKITEYIRNNFREGYLMEIKPVTTKTHRTFFKIDITENEILHHLQFSEKGILTKHESEPLFKEDYYEGEFYGKEP